MPDTLEIQPTLRDDLALERTVLANERTLLAYIRTAVALLITGVSAMHLPTIDPEPVFGVLFYLATGWVMIVASFLTVVIGWIRFRKVKRQIEASPAHGLRDLSNA